MHDLDVDVTLHWLVRHRFDAAGMTLTGQWTALRCLPEVFVLIDCNAFVSASLHVHRHHHLPDRLIQEWRGRRCRRKHCVRLVRSCGADIWLRHQRIADAISSVSVVEYLFHRHGCCCSAAEHDTSV